MVNQKSIIIGFLVAVILYFVIGFILPAYSLYAAVFLAALLTGYMATTDYMKGAIHGSLVGIFTAVFLIIILMLRSGAAEKIAGLLIILAVGYIGMSILIGALGGFFGALIKLYMGESSKPVTESKDIPKKPEVKEDEDKE
ncbi:DUF5518 domain-containing protein [Methanobacterium aggregans]|uniref:DUF5518 domain-containing protein n=1 Tax=Methanobacterium aggregans TaxID=1615586 RepID=UPI001AEB3157|nr:DUF5518 domain-containing protein [Methanobacterium aggregans]